MLFFDPKTYQNLCQKHSSFRRVEQNIEAGPSSVTIQAVSASTGVSLSAGVVTREGLLIDPGLPFRVTLVSHRTTTIGDFPQSSAAPGGSSANLDNLLFSNHIGMTWYCRIPPGFGAIRSYVRSSEPRVGGSSPSGCASIFNHLKQAAIKTSTIWSRCAGSTDNRQRPPKLSNL